MTARFGEFGGQYVAPALVPVLARIAQAYAEARGDRAFCRTCEELRASFIGRPTPLYHAAGLSGRNDAEIYLKREDLAMTGGSSINSALGQCLLARRLQIPAVVAESGSGRNGVATAAISARLGLQALIFMSAPDQAAHPGLIARMRLFGANVVRVDGSSLHASMSAAVRHWMMHHDESLYIAGGAIGPHPYPQMVREFQTIIGDEVGAQLASASTVPLAAAVAAAGGGASALGLFSRFIEEPAVRLIAVEAGGRGSAPGEHAAKLDRGRRGVLHGARTVLLQDDDGQILPTASVAHGLRYPAAAPELAALHAQRRVEALVIGDGEALSAREALARAEGIFASLESSHAIAAALQLAPLIGRGRSIVVIVSSGSDSELERVTGR